MQSGQAEQQQTPEEHHISGTEGPTERSYFQLPGSSKLSLFRSTGRKLSTWPNRLAQELAESTREMNNAAKKQYKTPGSNAKAAKSERNRDPCRGRAVTTAKLLHDALCLDPAFLTLSPSFLWIANGISLISPAHAVPLEEDESLCSSAVQTTEVRAQHPQLCPPLLVEAILTCLRGAAGAQQMLSGRDFAGRKCNTRAVSQQYVLE